MSRLTAGRTGAPTPFSPRSTERATDAQEGPVLLTPQLKALGTPDVAPSTAAPCNRTFDGPIYPFLPYTVGAPIWDSTPCCPPTPAHTAISLFSGSVPKKEQEKSGKTIVLALSRCNKIQLCISLNIENKLLSLKMWAPKGLTQFWW